MFAGCGDSGRSPCSYRAPACKVGAIWTDSTTWRLRNNAIAHGGKFGLLYACLFGGILGIGANRFAVALAVIPPFDEVAPFGMDFVLSADADSIATNPTLLSKSAGEGSNLPPRLES